MKQATAFGILIPLALMVFSDALRTWGWAAVGVLAAPVVVLGVAWWRFLRAIAEGRGSNQL